MSHTSRYRAPLRSVAAALGLGVGGLVAGTILVFAVQFAALSLGVELTPLSLIVTSLILLQGIAFGGVALGYVRLRGLDSAYLGVRVPSVRDLVAVVLGYVTALSAAFVGAVIVSSTGVQAGQNQVTTLAAQDPSVLLLLVPASFLLIGPGEELLFRGIVQNRIRESVGPAPGILLASAIFASIHFVALTGGAGGRLVTIGILFFPSLVFGTAYELTDNIVVPALVHGAYNATLFSMAYLAFRYFQMNPGASPGHLLLF